MQKIIFQIVHVLLLLLVLVEEAKLNNRSTINYDNAYVGIWHWWLVHRHMHMLHGHWPAGSCCACNMLTCTCAVLLGLASSARAKASTVNCACSQQFLGDGQL